jgi:uncharacterized protein with PQ loop repeat
MIDWIDYVFFSFVALLLACCLYLFYAIATAPDTITRQLPDGRTVVCTNAIHSECDWENAQ